MLPQNQSILGAIRNQIVAQEPVGKAWLLSTKRHMHIDSFCFTLFPWHEVKNHQKKLNQVYLSLLPTRNLLHLDKSFKDSESCWHIPRLNHQTNHGCWRNSPDFQLHPKQFVPSGCRSPTSVSFLPEIGPSKRILAGATRL